MKFTKVTYENERVFLPFLSGVALQPTPNMIRIGITDDKNNVAGVMAADTGHTFMELLSLYILPDFRRKGYGKRLMELLADAVRNDRYTAICAGYFEDGALSPFFSTLGYEIFPSVGRYSFSLGEFLRSEFCRHHVLGQEPREIQPIAQLDRPEKALVNRYFEDEKLPLLGWYDPAWSSVIVKNRDISSIMLCGPGHTGVALIWLYSKGQYQSELIQHLRHLVKMMDSEYARMPETRISFMAENTRMLGFVTDVLGGVRHLKYETRYVQAIKLL